jgi:protein subunit release factor B
MGNEVVGETKQEALRRRMADLGIADADLIEGFIAGAGSGGQKINKTASCVQLRHAKSGIVVKCQATRSRALNRYLARRELCDRIEERVRGAESRREQERERIRRQKRRRSRRQRVRVLEDKRHHAGIKATRRAVTDSDR